MSNVHFCVRRLPRTSFSWLFAKNIKASYSCHGNYWFNSYKKVLCVLYVRMRAVMLHSTFGVLRNGRQFCFILLAVVNPCSSVHIQCAMWSRRGLTQLIGGYLWNISRTLWGYLRTDGGTVSFFRGRLSTVDPALASQAPQCIWIFRGTCCVLIICPAGQSVCSVISLDPGMPLSVYVRSCLSSWLIYNNYALDV